MTAKMRKDESFLGKLGGTLARRKKSKEVSDLHEEGKNAINAPMLSSSIGIHPEDTLMEENAERVMLDPTSRESHKFKDLLKVLVDWINSELEEDRIIVKDLEEDCYDGQTEKLWGKKLNVAEVTQSEIVQKQKLQTVLESVNNLVAIVYLLVSLAMHFQAPIRLPEHVSVQVVVVKSLITFVNKHLNKLNLEVTELESQVHNVAFAFELMQDGGLKKPKARPEEERRSLADGTSHQRADHHHRRDAFDTLLDHAPDKLNVVKTSLITFVNKHLNKLNLEVTELESQVHNVAFAFELMQDGGLKKPKARPEDVVNLNLKSTLRVLYNLFTNYKNAD
ncbi:hypothetical protein CRUP_036508 [Coryphaenoides rupestris]|nr:hypothetical protein CRUP_036508 [Coryphaenoides rupestris]